MTTVRHWPGIFSLFLDHAIRKNQAKNEKYSSSGSSENVKKQRKCFFVPRMKSIQLIDHWSYKKILLVLMTHEVPCGIPKLY